MARLITTDWLTRPGLPLPLPKLDIVGGHEGDAVRLRNGVPSWAPLVSAKSEAVLDFGPWPGSNETLLSITGQGSIASTNLCFAQMLASVTPDHTESDHLYASALVDLSCSEIIPGSGFTIHACSLERMQGTFKILWAWL